MPFAKKRKISETSDHSRDTQNEPATVTASDEPRNEGITTSTEAPEKDNVSNENELSKLVTAEGDQEERRERFRALQIRAVSKTSINESLVLKRPR